MMFALHLALAAAPERLFTKCFKEAYLGIFSCSIGPSSRGFARETSAGCVLLGDAAVPGTKPNRGQECVQAADASAVPEKF